MILFMSKFAIKLCYAMGTPNTSLVRRNSSGASFKTIKNTQESAESALDIFRPHNDYDRLSEIKTDR